MFPTIAFLHADSFVVSGLYRDVRQMRVPIWATSRMDSAFLNIFWKTDQETCNAAIGKTFAFWIA